MASDQERVIVTVAAWFDSRDSLHVSEVDDLTVAIEALFPAHYRTTKPDLAVLRRYRAPLQPAARLALLGILQQLVLGRMFDLAGKPNAYQRIPDIIPPDIPGPMQPYCRRGNALVQFLSSLPEYFQSKWGVTGIPAWPEAFELSFPSLAPLAEDFEHSTVVLAKAWGALHPFDEPRFGYDSEAVPDPEEWAGTVIHGTLREEDLFPAFFDVYVQLPGATPGRAVYYLKEWATQDEYRFDVLTELGDEISALAPEGLYFGANEGDGSDFGFWPEFEAFEDYADEGD